MRYGILSILTSALLVLPGTVTASHCTLPVPDGGGPEPSPPSVTGTLLTVAPGRVLVRVTGVKTPQPVALTPSTELFTVYGGGIGARDLRVGQHALIWFKGCIKPKQGVPTAAVLQVCSLAAEPCP